MATRRLPLLGVALALTACQAPPPSGEPLSPLPSAPAAGAPIPAYPDLRGTWTAVVRVIYAGGGTHADYGVPD